MRHFVLTGIFAAILIAPLALQAASATHVGTHIVAQNWDLNYNVSNHDGVNISTAKFKGTSGTYKPVYVTASLQFIKVQYVDLGQKLWYDHLCTLTFDSNLLPTVPNYDPDRTEDKTCIRLQGSVSKLTSDPITLTATYGQLDTDPYTYVQKWTFSSTGHVASTVKILGQGFCDPDACSTYFSFYRVNRDVEVASPNTFFRCEGGSWVQKNTEIGLLSDGPTGYCSGHEWKQRYNTNNREVKIVPEVEDEITGQRPAMWALLYQSGEYDGGTGSDTEEPFAYENGQSINGVNIVTWYKSSRPNEQDCTQPIRTDECITGFQEDVVGYN